MEIVKRERIGTRWEPGCKIHLKCGHTQTFERGETVPLYMAYCRFCEPPPRARKRVPARPMEFGYPD